MPIRLGMTPGSATPLTSVASLISHTPSQPMAIPKMTPEIARSKPPAQTEDRGSLC
jgi:hypothetical protein